MDTPQTSQEQPYQPASTPFQLESAPAKSPKKFLIPLVVLSVLAGAYLAAAKSQSLWPFAPSATPSASVSPVAWKTYRNEHFGFEISYPAGYILGSEPILNPQTGQPDNDAATQALNQDLVDPLNSPAFSIGVTTYANLPKTKTLACAKSGGTLTAGGDCNGPPSPSQEELRQLSQAIASSKAGDEVAGGTVVILPSGARGIKSGGLPGFTPTFIVFDAANDRIDITGDFGSTSGSAIDPDAGNSLFDRIIATFKFTDPTAGMKTYNSPTLGISFDYDPKQYDDPQQTGEGVSVPNHYESPPSIEGGLYVSLLTDVPVDYIDQEAARIRANAECQIVSEQPVQGARTLWYKCSGKGDMEEVLIRHPYRGGVLRIQTLFSGPAKLVGSLKFTK